MLIFVDDLAAACLDPLVFSLFSSTLILDSEERSRILLTVAASLSEFPSTILTSFPLIGAWAKTIVEKTNMSIEVQKVFMATHNTTSKRDIYSPRRILAARTVLDISMAMVSGPMPPGTGV